MDTLRKDANQFVAGVTNYMKQEGKTPVFLPKVRELLRKVTSSAKKQQMARVESVVPLSPRERRTVEVFLETLLAHSVTLECRVNSALLGGILIRVGDWILDTTLLGQLKAMKESLV